MTIPANNLPHFHIAHRPDGDHLLYAAQAVDVVIPAHLFKEAVSHTWPWMLVDGRMAFLNPTLANQIRFTTRQACPLVLFDEGEVEKLQAPEKLSRHLLDFIMLQKLLDGVATAEMSVEEMIRGVLKKIAELPEHSFDVKLIYKIIRQKNAAGKVFISQAWKAGDYELIANACRRHEANSEVEQLLQRMAGYQLAIEWTRWLSQESVSQQEVQKAIELCRFLRGCIPPMHPLDVFFKHKAGALGGDYAHTVLVRLIQECNQLREIFGQVPGGKKQFLAWQDEATAIEWFSPPKGLIHQDNYKEFLSEMTFLQTKGTLNFVLSITEQSSPIFRKLQRLNVSLVEFMNKASGSIRSEITAVVLKSDPLSIAFFLCARPEIDLLTWTQLVEKAYTEGNAQVKQLLAGNNNPSQVSCFLEKKIPERIKIELASRTEEASLDPKKAQELAELFERLDAVRVNLLHVYYIPLREKIDVCIEAFKEAFKKFGEIFAKAGKREFFEALCENTPLPSLGSGLENLSGRDLLDWMVFVYAHKLDPIVRNLAEGDFPKDKFRKLAALYGNNPTGPRDHKREHHDVRKKIIKLVVARSPKMILAFFQGHPQFTDPRTFSWLIQKAFATEGVQPLEEEERLELTGLITPVLPDLVMKLLSSALTGELSQNDSESVVDTCSRFFLAGINPIEIYYNLELQKSCSLYNFTEKAKRLETVFAKAPEGKEFFIRLYKQVTLPDTLLSQLPDWIAADSYKQIFAQIAFLYSAKQDFSTARKMQELASSFEALFQSADLKLREDLLKALKSTGERFISLCGFNKWPLVDLFALEKKHPGLLPWDLFRERQSLDEKILKKMALLLESSEMAHEAVEMCIALEKLGFNPLQLYYDQNSPVNREFSDKIAAVFSRTAQGKAIFEKLRKQTSLGWMPPEETISNWQAVLEELAFAQSYNMQAAYRDKERIILFVLRMAQSYPNAQPKGLQEKMIQVMSHFPSFRMGDFLLTALDEGSPLNGLLPLIRRCAFEKRETWLVNVVGRVLQSIGTEALTGHSEGFLASLEFLSMAMSQSQERDADIFKAILLDSTDSCLALYMRGLTGRGDIDPVLTTLALLFELSDANFRERLIASTSSLVSELSEDVFRELLTKIPDRSKEIQRAALRWKAKELDADLAHGLSYQNIHADLKAVPEVNTQKLLEFFLKVSFQDPESPFYCHPSILREGEGVYSVENIRKNLADLVNRRIPQRLDHLAVPSEKTAKNIFYAGLNIILQHVVQALEKRLDTTDKTGKEIEEDKKTFTRAVVEIAMASCNCGTRWRDEGLNQLALLNNETPLGLEQTIRLDLARYRSGIAQGLFLADDIHGLATFMQTFGKVLNLPGYEFATKSFGTHEEFAYARAEETKAAFLEEYCPSNIASYLMDRYQEIYLFRERMQEKFASMAPQGSSVEENSQAAQSDPALIEAKAKWKTFLLEKEGIPIGPFAHKVEEMIHKQSSIDGSSEEEAIRSLEQLFRVRQNLPNRVAIAELLSNGAIKKAFLHWAKERSKVAAEQLREEAIRLDQQKALVSPFVMACQSLGMSMAPDSLKALLDQFLSLSPSKEEIEKRLNQLIDEALHRDNGVDFLERVLADPFKVNDQFLLVLEEYKILKKKLVASRT